MFGIRSGRPQGLKTWLLSALFVSSATLGHAQEAVADYPSKPVTLIVAKSTGGVDDTVGRLLATHLAPVIGQPVIVVNKPGAAGVTGTLDLIRSDPDGYTFMVINLASQVAVAAVRSPEPYDSLTDFAPVALVATYKNVLMSSNSIPAENLEGFVAYAKERPGDLSYGTGGRGSLNHLAALIVERQFGLEMVEIPYSSGGEASLALNSGDIQLYYTDINTAMRTIALGNSRAIGQSGAERSSLLPDVPLMSEIGMNALRAERAVGLIAPAATPPALIEKMNAAVNEALASPELLAAAANIGMQIPTNSPSAADFGELVRIDVETWVPIAREVMAN